MYLSCSAGDASQRCGGIEHEAVQSHEDRAHAPHGIPRLRVEIGHAQAQPPRTSESAVRGEHHHRRWLHGVLGDRMGWGYNQRLVGVYVDKACELYPKQQCILNNLGGVFFLLQDPLVLPPTPSPSLPRGGGGLYNSHSNSSSSNIVIVMVIAE